MLLQPAIITRVDSVEHGSFATAETFALMKARGTYLVPTLTIYGVAYAAAREHPELLEPGTAAKELANDQLPKKNFPLALKSGVKVAYGTDLGEGDHAMEFGLLIQGGMSSMDAIFTATRNAADLIGASGRIGAVAPGHEADIVATDGNPLSDSAQFEHVTFVMKGGVVYRQGRQPTAAGGGWSGNWVLALADLQDAPYRPSSGRLGTGSNSFVSAINARRLGGTPKAPSLAGWLNTLSRA